MGTRSKAFHMIACSSLRIARSATGSSAATKSSATVSRVSACRTGSRLSSRRLLLTDAGEQFLSADVPDLAFEGFFPECRADLRLVGFLVLLALAALVDELLGVVEGLADKEVGIAVEARILLDDQVEGFVEIGNVHKAQGVTAAVTGEPAGGWAVRQALTAQPRTSSNTMEQRNSCCCRVRLNIVSQ